MMKGSTVEAVNFELLDADPAEARRLVEAAASSIGWEVHEDDDEKTSDD